MLVTEAALPLCAVGGGRTELEPGVLIRVVVRLVLSLIEVVVDAEELLLGVMRGIE